MDQETQKQCPEFPYFGASYPDATCIDGRLHDLDDCPDEGGVYLKEEDYPCPFCRPQDAYELAVYCLDYSEQEDGESDSMFEQRMDLRLRENINRLREKHDFPHFVFTNPPIS